MDLSNSHSNGFYAAYFNSAQAGSNNSIYFNAQAGFNFGTGQFTIEFWMQPGANNAGLITDASVGMALIDFRPTSTNGVYPHLYLSATGNPANTRLFYYVSSAVVMTSASTFKPNLWYHIAVSRDSVGNTRMFVNGNTENSAAQAAVNYIVGAARPIIGASGFTPVTIPYNGFFSNLRIIKGAAAYTGNFTPSTSPLTSNSSVSLLTFQDSSYVDRSSSNLAINATTGRILYVESDIFSNTMTFGSPKTIGQAAGKTTTNNSVSFGQNLDSVAITSFFNLNTNTQIFDVELPLNDAISTTAQKSTSNNLSLYVQDTNYLKITSFFSFNTNTQFFDVEFPPEQSYKVIPSIGNNVIKFINDSEIEIVTFGQTQTGTGGGTILTPGLIQYWT